MGASRQILRESEVDGLVRTAKRLAEGSDETYVITNNHFAGKAVANALEILAGLGEWSDEVEPVTHAGTEAPLAPAELVEAYPRLRATTRVHGQASLF